MTFVLVHISSSNCPLAQNGLGNYIYRSLKIKVFSRLLDNFVHWRGEDESFFASFPRVHLEFYSGATTSPGNETIWQHTVQNSWENLSLFISKKLLEISERLIAQHNGSLNNKEIFGYQMSPPLFSKWLLIYISTLSLVSLETWNFIVSPVRQYKDENEDEEAQKTLEGEPPVIVNHCITIWLHQVSRLNHWLWIAVSQCDYTRSPG